MTALLEVEDLAQEYRIRRPGGVGQTCVQALRGVSFHIDRGETLGLVGESGSGKTTLARALLQAPRPRSGSVRLLGCDLTALKGRSLLERRRDLQIVFQDPYASLDPKWRVRDIVEEPLIGHGLGDRTGRARKVAEVLERVGLPEREFGHRRPTELSGGQRQRVAIARAIAPEPALIILDEAASSLDVLIQAQIFALLEGLRRDLGLSYLFISHDLAAVRQFADRIAVLHSGRLCEVGPIASFDDPLHPYAHQLRAAERGDHVPRSGRPASAPADDDAGCSFRTRCPFAADRCDREAPALTVMGQDHFVACHFPCGQRAASPDGAAPQSTPQDRPDSPRSFPPPPPAVCGKQS